MVMQEGLSSEEVRKVVEGKLQRRKRGVLGPPHGQRLLVVLEDLHLVVVGRFPDGAACFCFLWCCQLIWFKLRAAS